MAQDVPPDEQEDQVGLRGEAAAQYADEWIVGIEDVTALADRVRTTRDAALLPPERPYELPGPLGLRLSALSAR